MVYIFSPLKRNNDVPIIALLYFLGRSHKKYSSMSVIEKVFLSVKHFRGQNKKKFLYNILHVDTCSSTVILVRR